MNKVMVAYDHDSENLAAIELGFGDKEPSEWLPALRDIYMDHKIVWVRSDSKDDVWLRDRDGARKVRRVGQRRREL